MFKPLNGPYRRAHAWIWIISVLSLAIVFQVLGVPISFGNVTGTSDSVEATHLEGFSLLSSSINLFPISHLLLTVDSQRSDYRCLLVCAVFHPPHLLVP